MISVVLIRKKSHLVTFEILQMQAMRMLPI